MPPNAIAKLWICALLCGCSVVQPGANNRFAVSVAKTQFFKYGPAQAYGPDASLPKDEKLTMLKKDFGFSQVRLEDGTTGFVATEDLVQLPPEPKPKPAVLALRRRSQLPPEPERKLDLTDVPLPLP